MTYQQEKRQHHRFEMAYPIRLFSRGGEELAAARTVNISQGGTLFVLPAEKVTDLGETLNVTISMPESSYASENVVDFACQANVVRREAEGEESWSSVALVFSRPLQFTARA